MGEDSRFAGRGGKPKRQKRKAPEKIEETDVVVRCNGRVSAPENTVLVSLHKLEDYSLEGILAHVGNKLFDRPAAGLYHEDGIAVASLTLLKEGETIYAAANEDEIYVGCIADNASTLHTASTAEVSEIELAEKGVLNSKDSFIACKTFLGAKKGYFYAHLEPSGLGYHVDTWAPSGSKWGVAEVKQAAMTDLLARYGGEEYRGRCEGVHGLNEVASIVREAPTATWDVGAKPSRSQSRSITPPPPTPAPEKIKDAAAVAKTLSCLDDLTSTPDENKAAPVSFRKRGGGGGGGSTKVEDVQKDELSPAPVGLAEQEEGKEKKEKMSKRARKRAKIREGKVLATAVDSDEN